MTTNAKLYLTAFLLLGVCVLAAAFAAWNVADPVRFAAFLVLALGSSVLRAALPSVSGHAPFNFLFVFIGLFELSFPETLFVGCASVLIECLWQKDARPTVLDAGFSVANLAVAIGVSTQLIESLGRRGVPLEAVLAGTTVTFFLFNTFPLAAVIALTERSRVFEVWRDRYLGSFHWYIASALVAWGFHHFAEAAGWQIALLVMPVLYLLYRTYWLHVARAQDAKEHAESLASLHMRTIEALALAIEAKDDTTSDHLRRVQVYATELGRILGMQDEELEALRAASILHDIGKLAVPEYIISKPGKLTPDEFEKMKVHPVVGAEILQHVNFPYPVVPIVQAHHEKWNGTGYPYGLKGGAIPLGARILAAVDALDALASDRQYRRALPLDQAMEHIERESGTSFDPRVVEALRHCYRDLERMALNTGRWGLILSRNGKFGAGVAPAAGYAQPQFPPEPTWTTDQFQTEVNGAELRLEEMCSVWAVRLGRALPFQAIAIWLVREQAVVPVYVHGENHRFFSRLQIPPGQGLAGWAAENGKPVLNGNPSVEAGYLNQPDVFSTLRSALVLPLQNGAATIGAIGVYRADKDAFTDSDLQLMAPIASAIARAIASAAAN